MTQEATRKTIDAFQVLMTAGGRALTTCRQLCIKRRTYFVMFVTVNNDVHNIPVLVNKETVVKLRNSFEICMNRERLLKTRKHGGAPSAIDHVTGSRNEISLHYRFDVCWQIKVTSSKSKYTATRENWNYLVQFLKNRTWWLIIIIDAFKYIDSNGGSIFLYKIFNFDKIFKLQCRNKGWLVKKRQAL